MGSKNKKLTSFRIEPALIKRLEEHCNFREIKKSDFIRDAIKEKLLRSSIEENLSIQIDTKQIESTLSECLNLIEKKTNSLEDVVRSLTTGLNRQFEDINKGLGIIFDSINLPEEIPSLQQPSMVDQLLALLPANIDDLYLNLGDIDQVNEIIKELEKVHSIKFQKDTGMVELIE